MPRWVLSTRRVPSQSDPPGLVDGDTEIDFAPLDFDEVETEALARRRGPRETQPYQRGTIGAPVAPVRLPTDHDRPLPHPQVGGRYLNYNIRRRLARGAIGLVYEAVHLHLDRPVAIKFLHPPLLSDETSVLRFLAEARAMARIDHPGVPVIHDFGQDGAGNAYLIMERLEGDTVAERLETGEVGLGLALEIGAQVAEALAAAHRVGVIHRDLKPDNIFLVDEERLRIKLVDFGVAHFEIAERAGLETASGCLVGTPAFMAPEQTYSSEVTPATDLYALGCVLYELISGRPVFEGSVAELVDAHRHRRAPELSGRRRLPRALVALVAQMLEKQPAQRPGDAGLVARELRAIAETIGVRWVDPLATTDQLRRSDVDRAIGRLGRPNRLAEGTEAPPEDAPDPFAFAPDLEPEATPPPFYSTVEGTPQPFRPLRGDHAETTITTRITALDSRLWLSLVLASALVLGALLLALLA